MRKASELLDVAAGDFWASAEKAGPIVLAAHVEKAIAMPNARSRECDERDMGPIH